MTRATIAILVIAALLAWRWSRPAPRLPDDTEPAVICADTYLDRLWLYEASRA